MDRRIDESAFPNALFRRVIQAIEVKQLSPQEMYRVKEEAIWEDSRDASFRQGKDEGFDEGHDKGLKEGHDKGLEEGRRQGILDLCDVLGISLDEAKKAHLEGLDVRALDALRERIKVLKCWPE